MLKGLPGMSQQKAMEVAGLWRVTAYRCVEHSARVGSGVEVIVCVCDNAAAILILK